MSSSFRVIAAGLVIAILVSATLLVWQRRSARPNEAPNLDHLGGTILIYETASPGEAAADTMNRLVNCLRERFSAPGSSGISVRAVDPRHVAVEIPATPDHMMNIDWIRQRISKNGKLQFCIVANSDDDQEVFREAGRHFADSLKNPDLSAELAQRAREGLPPPLPPLPKDQKVWHTKHRELGDATYSWARVSDAEARANRLIPQGDDDQPSLIALRIAHAAEQAEPVVLSEIGNKMIFARKPCSEADGNTPQEKPALEVFMLIRETETDPTGERLLQVTGADIEHAHAMGDTLVGNATIAFVFSDSGGQRFHELTRANTIQPGRRSLAIILDGVVICSPTLREPIRKHGQIAGNFSRAEADALAAIIKSGELPISLRTEPVQTIVVAPRKPNKP